MRDYYLCYPAILTNTLVPQPSLSSILQNQLGVALDALTISPFLVIDEKPVEVFNSDKIMWNCRGKGIVFISSKKAPPEDVHISSLLLNANAHGMFYLWRSSSTYEDNSSCIYRYSKDNDVHNEKWTSAEWLHAEFIIASPSSRKRSSRPSSLSVTTQRTKCIKKTGVVTTWQKDIATTHMDPLEDYQLICFSPFCH